MDRRTVKNRVYQPWQEAVEREVVLPVYNVEALGYRLVPDAFSFPAEKQFEYLRDAADRIVGVIVRERQSLYGAVEIMSEKVLDGVFKVSVRVRNTTPFEVEADSTRDDALLRSLASTHTVLGVQDGRFVSLLAPPEPLVDLVANCKNVGTFPVWSAKKASAIRLLSSPIILYDYPRSRPRVPATSLMEPRLTKFSPCES